MNVRKAFPILVMIGLMTVAVYAMPTMDDQIESSFKNSYVYRNYLKDDSITIKSTAGVVQLSGQVADEHHNSLAEETAEEITGVQRVNNQLVVINKHPSESQDVWIAMKIKSSLLFHRSVSALRTHVDVNQGVVTLTGTANSQAEKELASAYTKDIDGVKSVINEMMVDEKSQKDQRDLDEKVDDASIVAQVKMTLLFHSSTSATGTKVQSKDGVVTLKGKAKNQAEKDLVSKLVGDIRGVRSVNNEMDVV